MNRNQKIGVGCGIAGCLGLIILGMVCAALFFMFRSSPANSNRSRNTNINSSSSNSNSNSTAEPSSSSSMSDDDKHKLWQAAGMTQDTEVIQKVMRKLNFIRADGTTGDDYLAFMKDHLAWAIKNREFMETIDTPEKARAYVEAHING